MSLEDKIERLTSALEANTAELAKVLAADEARGGAAGDTAEKKTRAKKTETTDAGKTEADSGKSAAAEIPADLKQGLSAWLGEFAKKEDKENPDGTHPEVLARKAALKKAFEGLGVKQLPDIKTEGDFAKLANWFGKAKAVDKGFGAGRFAADPDAGSEDDDDGLSV